MEGEDIGALLKSVGMTLVSSVGGAAGPLYGTLFLQMGTASAGRDTLDLAGWTDALDAGIKGVQARGKAEPGDKTMVDALFPALAALRAAADDGAGLGDALRRSAEAAAEGDARDRPARGAQGSRELSGAAQRGAPGSGRDVVAHAARRGGHDVRRRRLSRRRKVVPRLFDIVGPPGIGLPVVGAGNSTARRHS